MGSQVIATCECGLRADVLIGGGMLSFRDTCYFPCLCKDCSSVVQVNLLGKTRRCPTCGTTRVTPYDDPSLSISRGSHVVAEWNMQEQLGRVLRLTDGKYKCPRCRRPTLLFACGDVEWD